MTGFPIVTPLSSGGPVEVRESYPSSRVGAATLIIAGGMALSSLMGGTAYAAVRQEMGVVGGMSDWTSSGWTDQSSRLDAETVTASNPPLMTAEVVQQLHDISGLTWDQLSKVLGVSRRAVHLWAAGGAMNSQHEELARHLLSLVRRLGGNTPAERRAALLRPGDNGMSVYDELRARKGQGVVISGSPFTFDQLIGTPDN